MYVRVYIATAIAFAFAIAGGSCGTWAPGGCGILGAHTWQQRGSQAGSPRCTQARVKLLLDQTLPGPKLQ